MKFGIIVAAGLLALGASAFAAGGPTGGWGNDNTTWSTATGSYALWNAIYTGTTTPANEWQKGTETGTGTGEFTVTADIEMWLSMAFSATEIKFHIGRDLGEGYSKDTGLSQTVTGWLNSNNGQYLFVTKKPNETATETGLSKLVYTNDSRGLPATTGSYLGSTGAAPNTIDVSWKATDSTNADVPLTYSQGGNAGKLWGFQWLLDNGTIGSHPFSITCTIHPDRFQQDGHYEMDPVLVATPEL